MKRIGKVGAVVVAVCSIVNRSILLTVLEYSPDGIGVLSAEYWQNDKVPMRGGQGKDEGSDEGLLKELKDF